MRHGLPSFNAMNLKGGKRVKRIHTAVLAVLLAVAVLLPADFSAAASVPVEAGLPVFFSGGAPVLLKGVPAGLSVWHAYPPVFGVKALQADFDTQGVTIDSVVAGPDLPEGYSIEWNHIDDSLLRIGIVAPEKLGADLPSGELVRCSAVPRELGRGKIAPKYAEITDLMGNVLSSGPFVMRDAQKEPFDGEFGIVEALLRSDPDPVEMPAVKAGQSSSALFTIRSDSDEDLAVDLRTAGGPFSFEPDQGIVVPAKGSVEVRGFFKPVRAGRLQTVVLLRSGETLVGAFTAAGTAQPAAQAQPALSPSYVDFGPAIMGKETKRTLTLTNKGDGAFVGGVRVLGDAFALVSSGRISLPSGESVSVVVGFTPQAQGTATGTIEIDADAPGSSRNSIRAGLSGFGLDRQAAETVVPQNIFMSRPGLENADVALENIGAVPLDVSIRRYWAPYARAFFDWTFKGTTNDESVDFTLDADEKGDVALKLNDYISQIRNHVARNTMIVIFKNADENYQRSYTVTVRGLEDAAVPIFQPRERTMAFGGVLTESRMVKAVHLANEGRKGMTCNVAISGEGFSFVKADLSLTSDPQTGTLAGGDSRSFQVAFAPSAPGDSTGVLVVTATEDGGANTWTRTYALTGTGKEIPAVECDYPASIVIPSVPEGTEIPPSQTFVLRNSGSADGLTVRGELAGAGAESLALDPVLSDDVTLNAGEERIFSIALKSAETAGIVNATLKFVTNQLADPALGPGSAVRDPFEIPVVAEVLTVGDDGVPPDKKKPEAADGLEGDKKAGVGDKNGNSIGIGVDHDVVSRDIELAAPLNFDDAVKAITVSADWGEGSMELPSGLWNITLGCSAGEVVVFRVRVNNMPDDAGWWKLTWSPDDYSTSFRAMTELTPAEANANSPEAIAKRNEALYPDAGHPGAGFFVRLGNNIVELHVVEGGVFDADKLRNGLLVDPGGVGRLTIPAPDPDDPANTSSGGGCDAAALPWTAALLLLPLLALKGKRSRVGFFVLMLLLATGSPAMAARVEIASPEQWLYDRVYQLPVTVEIGEDEAITAFTIDLRFRSDLLRPSPRGIVLSSALVRNGWKLRATQMDLPGNIRMIRILLYSGSGTLESGELFTLPVSLAEAAGSRAASRALLLADQAKVGGSDGRVGVVPVNVEATPQTPEPKEGSGCGVAAFPAGALLLLLPMTLLLRRK